MDCPSIGAVLRYSLNSGAYTAVPDTFGADNPRFIGTTNLDQNILSSTVTCCISGALTANDGSTQRTASAVPTFDLAQDASVVQRYILELDTDATPGDTYDFRLYDQDGTALNTYTQTGRVTVLDYTAGSGF